MRIIATDPFVGREAPAWTKHDVERVALDTLLATADAVSLHVPLNAETRNLIDAPRLEQMKPSAILINAARGGVVDEAALAEALKAGRLKGAALDVFAQEPLRAGIAARGRAEPHRHAAYCRRDGRIQYAGQRGDRAQRAPRADRKAEVMAHVLSIAEAQARVASLFVKGGARAEAARSVARALVGAEADGLKGHGLSRIPTYLQMVRSGKINGTARPWSTRPRPGVLAIDAAHGFAYPALDLAVAELAAIAAEQGIAAASIRRSSHCGETGLPCEALARQGLVALLLANTPGAMAPWGGRQPVFGTNPIAFAAPLQGREPVVVDLALSKVARGPIVAAKQRGESIPQGWALDADGNPTTEPDKALAGSMIPLGDAKGAALAFMVEVLAACLTGANLAFEASSFLDGEGPPPATGQLLLAIDPAAFGGGQFGERMAALAAAIEQQPGARLPGARRLANRARAAREGIVVPPNIAALGDWK